MTDEKNEKPKVAEPVKKKEPPKKEVKKPTPKKEEINPFNEMYKKLSAPIEEEYIIEYVDDGVKLRGYNAIAAVNRLNEVIGINNWRIREEIRKEEIVNGAWAVSAVVDIQIIDSNDKIVVLKTGFGGAYAKKIENAYKGALTSAFKNACKYLGIGKELYMDNGLDDDIVYVKEEEEVVVEDLNEDALILEEKINKATNIEELQALKDSLASIEDKYKQVIFKKYNDKKIQLMTK